MNKQEIKGKSKSRRGRVNEARGVLTEDPRLERHGAQQRAEGGLESFVGEMRRRFGEMIERLGTAIKT
ncbi:MAG: hypothetical protein IPP07_04260 [Holophagales bacterium]|jgi:uncharacterized protein YjbJ (UPF0337 family)|nr:hypothetical protein [Holophagales bacterium]MBK9964139.1 hypothetical protein [Holophagales bacterium]